LTIASKSHLDWIVNVSIVGSDSQTNKPAIFNTCLDGFECIQYKESIPAANVCVCIVGSDSQPSKPAIFNTCLDGFECIQYKECIPAANVCDGYMDCVDRSDEINCGNY
jgi:hypothetical protein